MPNNTLTAKLNRLAEESGLDAIGFADASEFKGYRLGRSIRRDPKLSLPDAKTIIVAGVYIGGITLPVWQDPWYGRTSRLYLSGYFLDMVKPLDISIRVSGISSLCLTVTCVLARTKASRDGRDPARPASTASL